uniref:OBG-type G domain-containing protein n=1 Tax=Piliocolobus tephrosceles TaxID=591936 RepID=A0A8C9IS07_9PRIM
MGILTLAKIVEIKAKMTWTQKNKATAHHLGLLKAHLGGGGGGPGEGFDVAKTGDAHTGFAGFPSVGKLTLLSNLAGVYSEVAACEFTTLTTAPGVIRHKGAKIQLLDLPGIIKGAKNGKGRGQVIAVALTCNLILIVLDVLKPLGRKKINENELEGFGIRLNSKPSNTGFKKKDKGGINLIATCLQSEFLPGHQLLQEAFPELLPATQDWGPWLLNYLVMGLKDCSCPRAGPCLGHHALPGPGCGWALAAI